MIGYAARAVPWTPVCAAAALVVLMMEVVGRWPVSAWPLAGTSVGVLAAAGAWCCDEPAAGVVDVAPRRLLWRTAARCLGLAVPAAAWAVSVHRSADALFGHAGAVLLQGVVGLLAGVGWATWRRAGGEPRPGGHWAAVVVPVVMAWALIRPFERRVPVFPFAVDDAWAVSVTGWAVVGIASVLLTAAALTDAPWRYRPG